MDDTRSRHEIVTAAKTGDARAQYILAAMLQREGKPDEAEPMLQAAAENGEPDALYTLATRQFYGGGVLAEAVRLVALAADKGSTAAERLRIVLQAEGCGEDEDWHGAVKAMCSLAQAGDPVAQRDIAGLLIMDEPDDKNAAALIATAARKDAVAAAVCVRRFGQRRQFADRRLAENAMGRLTAANYPRERQLHKELMETDHVAEPAPAADWKQIRDALLERRSYAPPAAEVLCEGPEIRIHRDVIIPEMLEYIIAHAASRLRPSTTIDSRDGSVRLDAYRTSLTSILGLVDLDLAVAQVNRRMAIVAEHDYRSAEFLSILRYATGDEYRPHFDWLSESEDFSRAGQRVKTALLCLNDDFEGGETYFLTPELFVKGRAGDVLVFTNVHADGAPDMRTRHAGRPVTSGAKWIATKWFRSKPYIF